MNAVRFTTYDLDDVEVDSFAFFHSAEMAGTQECNVAGHSCLRLCPRSFCIGASHSYPAIAFADYDGFVVTHSPVLCRLFERFNKPIILVNSCRYDQPYCWNHNQHGREVRELCSLYQSRLLLLFEPAAALFGIYRCALRYRLT